MTKTALKYAIKGTPGRLKLAGLIDHRNVAEEQMRDLQDRAEATQQGQVARRLRDIETSVRLAVIEVVLEEAQLVVNELDAAAKVFVRQVGTVIQMLDDFDTVTKASGCKHGDLQAAYAKHAALNEEVSKIGTKLVADMNLVAAEAAASKWLGTSSGGESGLAVLAEALLTNPMATLKDVT